MGSLVRLAAILAVLAVAGLTAQALCASVLESNNARAFGNGDEFRVEDYPSLRGEIDHLTNQIQESRLRLAYRQRLERTQRHAGAHVRTTP